MDMFPVWYLGFTVALTVGLGAKQLQFTKILLRTESNPMTPSKDFYITPNDPNEIAECVIGGLMLVNALFWILQVLA